MPDVKGPCFQPWIVPPPNVVFEQFRDDLVVGAILCVHWRFGMRPGKVGHYKVANLIFMVDSAVIDGADMRSGCIGRKFVVKSPLEDAAPKPPFSKDLQHKRIRYIAIVIIAEFNGEAVPFCSRGFEGIGLLDGKDPSGSNETVPGQSFGQFCWRDLLRFGDWIR